MRPVPLIESVRAFERYCVSSAVAPAFLPKDFIGSYEHRGQTPHGNIDFLNIWRSSAALPSEAEEARDFSVSLARELTSQWAPSFEFHFDRYITSGSKSTALTAHPEASSSTAMILRLARNTYPTQEALLLAAQQAVKEQDPTTLRWFAEFFRSADYLWKLDTRHEVPDMLCYGLLRAGDYAFAQELLTRIPPAHIRFETWQLAVIEVARGKLCSLDILWLLLGTEFFSIDTHSGRYSLPAEVAAMLLVATHGVQATPLLGAEVMRRYHAHCTIRHLDVHPTPLLMYLRLLRSVRAPGSRNALLHWTCAWRPFQYLNRSTPDWYLHHPEEARQICLFLIDIMASGANPYMTLQLSKRMAARRILDGVEISMRMLQRIGIAGHHPEETRDVVAQLFNWLLNDVGIHLQPALQQHVLSAARVLARLHMTKELSKLHGSILSNILVFSLEFRQQLLEELSSVMCVYCNTVYADCEGYALRRCPCCLRMGAPISSHRPRVTKAAVYPASLPLLAPSLSTEPRMLVSEAISRLHESQRAARIALMQRAEEEIGSNDTASHHQRKLRFNDPVLLIREGILGEPPFIPAEPTGRSYLHLAEGSDAREAGEEAAKHVEKMKRDLEEAMRLRGGRSSKRNYKAFVEETVSVSIPSRAPAFGGAVSASLRYAQPSLWSCAWCKQDNDPALARERCTACGAETGPTAAWRTFAYSITGDVMEELRTRMRKSFDSTADGIAASYLLMTYYRAFLMRATSEDLELVKLLIRSLVAAYQRVMAAYVYMRALPASARKMDKTLIDLATLFGTAHAEQFLRLTPSDIRNDGRFVVIVFGENTCRVCFSQHPTASCPILTRDFSKFAPPVALTAAEASAYAMRGIVSAVRAAEHGDFPVQEAYKAFILYKQREEFASTHTREANCLVLMLSEANQFRRAAFVLCHIPLALRENAAYLSLCTFFGVPRTDAEAHLSKRIQSDPGESTHPNFVQVVLTCCICLAGSHASHECSRFRKWAANCDRADKSRAVGLRAQVGSWTGSGPERLHAFTRFLLNELERVGTTNKRHNEEIYAYALNHCVMRLVETGQRALAWRLYAHLPGDLLNNSQTTQAILRMGGMTCAAVREALASETKLQVWIESFSLPIDTHCLLCFDHSHVFFDCPELLRCGDGVGRAHAAAEILGSIQRSPIGVTAAADYVYDLYQRHQLKSASLRSNCAVARSLLALASRCFSLREMRRGFRLLRRIPPEMLEVNAVEEYWRAAGLPEELKRQSSAALLDLHRRYKFTPSCETAPSPPDGGVNKELSGLLEFNVCRYCCEYGHSPTQCALFRNEASLGRDMIATYRIAMVSDKIPKEEVQRTVMRLALFVIAYQRHLPFHILGVQRCANGLAAIAAMMFDEAGVALRVLRAIPPCYRMRHVYAHIITALDPSLTDEEWLQRQLLTIPTAGGNGDRITTDSLVSFRAPVDDTPTNQLFARIPRSAAAVRHADDTIFAAADPARRGTRIKEIQAASILQIREAFDPIQRTIEDAFGSRIGSRSVLFESSISILGPDSPG